MGSFGSIFMNPEEIEEEEIEEEEMFLQKPTTAHKATSVHNRLLFYYTISRALENGSPPTLIRGVRYRRAPLPLELVIQILRLSGLKVPSRSLTVKINSDFQVRARHQDPARKIWFTTRPLTKPDVLSIAAVRLITMSRNQGWVNDPKAGNWSWWELVAGRLKKDEEMEVNSGRPRYDAHQLEHYNLPSEPDDNELTKRFVPRTIVSPKDVEPQHLQYFSHHNDLSSQVALKHTGPFFEPSSGSPLGNDYFFYHLQEGDVIAVQGCAQFPGWTCVGELAQLQVWKFFVPKISFGPAVAAEEEEEGLTTASLDSGSDSDDSDD